MSILTGNEIVKCVRSGDIQIDPFNETQVNPTSYDMRLGREVFTYQRNEWLDVRRRNQPKPLDWDPDGTILLQPGVGYLMHTEERIGSTGYVPVLDGKSSLGRLFLWVHVTAGYIDPGFFGHVTLEVVVVYPVRIVRGMRFCQLRFHEVVGEISLYEGHYRGKTANGAVASQSFRQIAGDEGRVT